VTIDGDAMTVRAIGGEEGGELQDIDRFTPEGRRTSGPIIVKAGA
jgi:hypothetical protein